MAKCIRCGKSTIVRGHVKLADAAICTPCFKALGYKLTDTSTASLYKYDDIKDGKEEADRRRWAKQKAEFARSESDRLGLFFADYATLDALDCSDNEMKAVERVCALLDDDGCNPRKLEYERDPGAPLSVFLGDELVYELKYTKDIKWIRLATETDKVRITGPAGLNRLQPRIVAAYNAAKNK